MPRRLRLTVTGSNVTEPEPLASSATCFGAPTGMLSTCSFTLVAGSALSVRLITPAVTVTRSWFENVERAKVTPVTPTFGLSITAFTGIGVSTAPAGSRAPSPPCQPPRWKSLISTASRRGSDESDNMLPATFSAGPYRVAPAPGFAVDSAADSLLASDDDRTRMSAPDENRTSDARSDALTLRSASSAAARACAHRSP